MANGPHSSETSVGVPAEPRHEPSPLNVDAQMVVWTWITFAVVATILYKVAWKPIMSGLEAREERIRQALDDAEQAREELENLEATARRRRDELAEECKKTLAQTRAAAHEAAAHIEKKATEKVAILYENAERDINAMKNRAVAAMQREQAGIIVELAGRLVVENLDTAKNRALTDKLLKEL